MNPGAPVRPRRSTLFVPGSNARALQKAAELPVDGLILDLEDAVLPAAKPGARSAILAAVAARPFGHREVVIRINGLDTEWGMEDLRAAATSGADGILLSKVEQGATLLRAARVLEDLAAPARRMSSTASIPDWRERHVRQRSGPVARRKLTQLNRVRALRELAVPPGNHLERLRGDRAGQHSIRINDQYRVCFRWEAENADEVEIVDYH